MSFTAHSSCCCCFQEISKASISYYCRDNLRNSLKKLKKLLDDLDKARKAALMNEVKDMAGSSPMPNKISDIKSLR